MFAKRVNNDSNSIGVSTVVYEPKLLLHYIGMDKALHHWMKWSLSLLHAVKQYSGIRLLMLLSFHCVHQNAVLFDKQCKHNIFSCSQLIVMSATFQEEEKEEVSHLNKKSALIFMSIQHKINQTNREQQSIQYTVAPRTSRFKRTCLNQEDLWLSFTSFSLAC